MRRLFTGLTAEERAAITTAMSDCARRAGRSEVTLWQAAIAFWERQSPESDASLVSEFIRFSELFVGAAGRIEIGTDVATLKIHRVRRRHLRTDANAGRREFTREAVRAIFNAASTLTQLYGVVFNTRIVVRHQRTGADYESGALEVSDFVHEASQQLRRMGGGRLHYIYRHRKTAEDGFISGIVCHIPLLLADPMLDWAERFMERRLGSDIARCAVSIRLTDHSEVTAAVRRHWRLVRGLCAGLNPDLHIKVGDERHALIRLLKIPARLSRRGDPLNVIQRYRVSETIGVGAQRRATTEAMPLLSPFHDQAWDALASGWELDEFRERSQEAQDRRLAEERIRALWPAAQDGFQESIRNLEFKKLKASWACDPHDRQRAWRGWWLPLSATTAVDPLPSPVRHRIGI